MKLISKIQKTLKTYNLVNIENNSNYFANGVLVPNKSIYNENKKR